MTMSEFGPTENADESTNRICACPSGPVVTRSEWTMLLPMRIVRAGPPGGWPVACGLTAVATPTFAGVAAAVVCAPAEPADTRAAAKRMAAAPKRTGQRG